MGAVVFRALACDYDGTLASHDRIGPKALGALGRAREAGVRLVLVTGRTFFDLARVCEWLDRFDAVVAENGAVLYLPSVGMIRDQGPSPPPRLLAELERRDVPYQLGRVIVGAARSAEADVRQAMAASGVRFEIAYNRAALMLLPAGIGRGTGVQLHIFSDRELAAQVRKAETRWDRGEVPDLRQAMERLVGGRYGADGGHRP